MSLPASQTSEPPSMRREGGEGREGGMGEGGGGRGEAAWLQLESHGS